MTKSEALALVKRHRFVTLAPSPRVPSLVRSVAGSDVHGSWWGHPKGGEIYNLSVALADHPDVLVVKLVDKKVTFVHRAAWPPLLRIVTDEGYRKRVTKPLDAVARKLLDAVEREGEIRLDHWGDGKDAKALAKARRALEEALLVLSSQVHTDKGKHATVLRSWKKWAQPDVTRAAAALGLDDAAAAIGHLPL